jgi:hypothetical protein
MLGMGLIYLEKLSSKVWNRTKNLYYRHHPATGGIDPKRGINENKRRSHL